jgi:hypothetical protein
MPGGERIRARAGVLVAAGAVVALLVVAVTVGRVSAASRGPARVTALDVLRADGIAGARFGASPAALRDAVDAVVGHRGGGYLRGGSCQLDHEITWRDGRTGSGQPELIAYFRRSAFAGYQFGGLAAPRRPPGGWTLATTRGLRLGDTLARGRHLYGQAFAMSTAQGGSWSVRVARGQLVGYAWGRPKYGDVSWQSVVATIDAGDVGCAALTP